MKIYKGTREGYCARVVVNDHHPLDPRFDLWNHSPNGFEWGYDGSGPAQLALALLADHLSDDQQALALHQDFKGLVVTRLPHLNWELISDQIEWWVKVLEFRPTAKR